jgi:hypothetical protein
MVARCMLSQVRDAVAAKILPLPADIISILLSYLVFVCLVSYACHPPPPAPKRVGMQHAPIDD